MRRTPFLKIGTIGRDWRSKTVLNLESMNSINESQLLDCVIFVNSYIMLVWLR